MFSIVLKDGKIINIKADEVEWSQTTRTIGLIYDRQTVARINMDNVVGWIHTDYKAESEDTFSDYPDMPYQFDNMTGSMNL